MVLLPFSVWSVLRVQPSNTSSFLSFLRCHRISSVLAVVSLSPSVHPVKPTETWLWYGSSSRAPRSPLTGSAVIMAGGVKQSLVCAIGVFACKHTWEHTHQRARSRTEDGTQTTKHLMGEELPRIDMLQGGGGCLPPSAASYFRTRWFSGGYFLKSKNALISFRTRNKPSSD